MDQRIITASDAQVSESNFISKVYLWMSLGLIVSAIASVWLLSQPVLLKALFTHGFLLIALMVVEVGLVIWLSAAVLRMSAAMATSLFLVYSFLNGITLSSIFLVYTGGSIMTTFAVTAGTFFFFSLYGLTTKKDLTSVGSLAMMALVGVIIASVVNIFLKSPALMWVMTFVGIAVFLGLIAYDTQKLKTMHAHALQDAELGKKLAVIGALALYLDFINLFMLLLRLFGNRRD
ncbi:MAG TPA: Bax inhibitor-1/YccA family protein [Candidatus Eisenbacteria bacterium]|nr:Bax inhibitor-1/YccA family protein [Candidatus Eisenbacteria bacterium]